MRAGNVAYWWKADASWGILACDGWLSSKKREADMTGILDKFHVEHGIHGAKVMTRTHQLTSDCISNGEIDSAIQMLKDDLDACAREMKRLLEVNRRGAMFEGWPSANDDTLN